MKNGEERALAHESPSGDRSPVLGWLSRGALFCVAPILAILAYVGARGVEEREIRAAFRQFVADRHAEVERELARCLESLHSLRSFFDSSVLVEREEFANFTRNTIARRSSIRALGWAPRIVDEERPQHEALVRQSGIPDYEITTLGEDGRPATECAAGRTVFPVVFAEPQALDPDPLGFDLASDPERRQALLRAAALGTAVMTPPIDLGDGSASEPSGVAFLAIREEVATSADYLDSELRGVVLMEVRYRDLVARALGDGLAAANAGMRFRLLDVGDGREEHVLFDNRAESAALAAPDVAPARDEFRIAERTIAMVAEPTETFLESHRNREPLWVAVVAGLAASLGITIVWMHLRRVRTRAARQHDSLLRSVLTSLGEGVVVADRDGRVRFVNDVAVRALGPIAQSSPLDWPTVCGIFLEDGKTPCPVDHMPLVRAIRGERVASEHMLVRNESTPEGRWFGVSASPLLDESHRLCGGVAVLRDITGRKRTQGQLLRLSAAVQQTADAVMITDRDGVIVYVNRAFEAATGYPADEAIGRTPRILKSGEHATATYSDIWNTLLAGKVYRGTLTNRRRDGSLFESQQTITPIRDEFDGSVFFVSVAKELPAEPVRIPQQSRPAGRNGLLPARHQQPPQSSLAKVAPEEAARNES